MYDLASALTNDTSMIDYDVRDMYEFEKKLSVVMIKYFVKIFSKLL